MDLNASFDYVYKIIMIGDSGVGKSNIVDQFVNCKFTEDGKTTIGIDFEVRQVQIGADVIRLQIWDTAGQERFRSITRSYYQMAAGIIVVFDLTRRETFESVNRWLYEIENNVDDMARMEIMLIGNKSDLEHKREVFTSDISKVQERYNVPYIETSAKADINIEEAFKELVTRVHDHKKYLHSTKFVDDDVNDIVKLIEDNRTYASSCGCIII